MAEVQQNAAETNPGTDRFAVPPAENLSAGTLQGSMQRVLAENLGRFVVCEFFEGDGIKETRAGILHHVGAGELVLYDDANQSYLVCDAGPLRFTTFTAPERQPAQEVPQEEMQSEGNAAQSPQAQSNPPTNQLTPLPTPGGMQLVGANSQVKAAFNYTKRRSRR